MKHLFMLLIGSLMALSATAQAVIKFEKTTHNFGAFKESQVQKVTFVFTNTGDEPLVIQQAFSSCGCTVAKFSKDPVAPGAKGQVTVSYNGKNKVPGHFKKPVSIRSNAANSLVRIYIEGICEAE